MCDMSTYCLAVKVCEPSHAPALEYCQQHLHQASLILHICVSHCSCLGGVDTELKAAEAITVW